MRNFDYLILMLTLLVGLGCGQADPASPVSGRPAGDLESTSLQPILSVTTAPVERGSIAQHVSAPGSLMARRESRIGTEVRGRIQTIFVQDGDRVEAGAELFQIDPAPYQVNLRQAEAGLDLARAERKQIEADLARLSQLHSRDIVAADELARMKTQVAVAKARERQAKESVALARHNLEQTLVVAPYGGSIAARLVDEGTTALVQPQTTVVVLQETTQLEAEANIPESQLAIVRVGDSARIHVQGLGQAIETTVATVGDTIDPTTRTYHVRLLIDNADHRLKAGVFAHIEITPEAKTGILLVPREAVRSEDGQTRVLVVRDGRAVPVRVELGLVDESRVEVVSGLTVDDAVIVGAAAREIAPGMRVQVVAQQAEPAT
ncbi:MAG: efflux RND transporter periplasmic adaptor subunit [Deltaproteobacteria bacterium]|nr:efflux RND transporter periplasmic adaptor subunit [Deltaproteobacteria bacterium]